MNNDGTAVVLTSISLSLLYAAVNRMLSAYRTSLAFWYPPKLITPVPPLNRSQTVTHQVGYVYRSDGCLMHSVHVCCRYVLYTQVIRQLSEIALWVQRNLLLLRSHAH